MEYDRKRLFGDNSEMNYKYIKGIYNKLRKMTDIVPKMAIVLGTGFGGFENEIEVIDRVDYHSLDGMPVSTVEGHKGEFLFGYLGKVPVAAMKGRVHYYEGYSMQEVVLPIRLLKMMGAEVLFLSNAAGGVNKSLNAGDLMLITDHISSFVPSPLIGKNIDELGTRFPDMSCVYDRDLCDIIRRAAREAEVELKEGVYVQLTGPNFETPAEVNMLRAIGADAVGMSTAVEAMTARHCGMRVCAISCISNASGSSDTHEQVQAAVQKAEQQFNKLVRAMINQG